MKLSLANCCCRSFTHKAQSCCCYFSTEVETCQFRDLQEAVKAIVIDNARSLSMDNALSVHEVQSSSSSSKVIHSRKNAILLGLLRHAGAYCRQ